MRASRVPAGVLLVTVGIALPACGGEETGLGSQSEVFTLAATAASEVPTIASLPPGAGNAFLIVDISLSNQSVPEALPLNLLFFKLRTDTNLEYLASGNSALLTSSCRADVGVAAGGAASCRIAFEVPTQAVATELFYDDAAGHHASASVPSPVVLGPCGPTNGEFLFAISTNISPKKPILFDSVMTTAGGPNALTYSMSLQPLAIDRITPTGSSFMVGPEPVNADGTFTSALPTITVPGAANPIIIGSAMVATITLHGDACTTTDFLCGTVTGTVTQPLALDLGAGAGSTFTMERLSGPGQYPNPPKINCAGDPADPPP